MVDAVTGRWQRSVVQSLAAASIFAYFAGNVRKTSDISSTVGRASGLVSPLARRRRGEKL